MKKKILTLFFGVLGLATLVSCGSLTPKATVDPTKPAETTVEPTTPAPTTKVEPTTPVTGGTPSTTVEPTTVPTTVEPTTVPTTVTPTTTGIVEPTYIGTDSLTINTVHEGKTGGYGDWEYTGDSGATYAGYTAFGDKNKPCIQLREGSSDKQPAGIMVTESIGSVAKIDIKFNTKTFQKRTIVVYGFETPYDDVQEMLKAGMAPIAEFKYDQSNGITDFSKSFSTKYPYIGIAAEGGASYLEEIKIYWSEAEEIVKEPAGKELEDAIALLQTNNYTIKYSYVGTNDFKNSAYDVTISYLDDKMMVVIKDLDLFGEEVEYTYYYYKDGEKEFLVFAQSDEENDWGDFDLSDLDLGDYLTKKQQKALGEDDTEETQLTYTYIDSNNPDFDYYFAQFGFMIFDFSKLDYKDFTKTGNTYEINANKANEIATAVIGDSNDEGDTQDDEGYDYHYKCEETFTKVIIQVSNGEIVKIKLTSNYKETDTYEGDEPYVFTGKFNYTIDISKYGEVSFEIPEASLYIAEPSISSIYELNHGDQITLKELYVNGINTAEKVVYVCDDYAACALHYGDLELTELPVIGGSISTTATVRVSGELYELVAVNMTVNNDNPAPMQNIEISNVSVKDYTFTGETVNFDYLLLKTKDIENNNVVFETYYGKEIKLLFDASEAIKVTELLKDSTAGSSAIKLSNVAITFDDEDFALRLLDNAKVTLANGLVCEKEEIAVDLHTELTDAVAAVNVCSYIAGVKSILTPNDFTYTCDDYDKEKIGTYLLTINNGDELQLKVSIRVKYGENTPAFIEENGKGIEFATQRYGVTVGLPSTGDVEILVIPVEFKNAQFENNYKDILNKGSNGTSEETGWESLSSYYKKSSGNKLNIHATILDKYETNENYYHAAQQIDDKTYPEDFLDGYASLDHKYLEQAIAHYNDQIDYSQYDANNDGNIDCVYLVYSCSVATGDNDLDMWWAYTSQFVTKDFYNEEVEDPQKVKYDNKEIDVYLWFSIDFFSEELKDSTTDEKVAINAETVIHESGHALGLDDYYDTSYNQNGGYGGGIMMDWNVGDHDPFSKALLGWINPYIVINSDAEITINAFESTGDAIFIARDYNGVYFNEYIIVDLYTPTGLNELQKGTNGLPDDVGVRIIHADGRVKADTSEITQIWGVTATNNSNGEHKLLSVVEADRNDSISEGQSMTNSDLWIKGSTASNLSWYGNEPCGFTITVKELDKANGTATIVVDFE